MKTIVGLYGQREDAARATRTLENAGFSASSVRILRSVGAMWQHLGCTPRSIVAKDFATGATLGMALFSLLAVPVAVGEITLAFAPVTVIGMLLILVVGGTFVGGLLGVFFGIGNLDRENRLYVTAIHRGDVLVVVRTADEHTTRALDILRRTDAKGVRICWRTSDRPARHGLPRPKDRLSLWLRRVARGLGSALLLLVLAFFIGERMDGGNTSNLPAISLAEDFVRWAMFIALLGTVVAWRWEAIGGGLIVSGVLLSEAIDAIAGGYWRLGALDPWFVLVGLLFLWDAWRTATGERAHPTATYR